ncbi:MAG TPA: bifunctional UDP-N-acetylglucosamine diphosphorylase/glucosamine-1-phosphate N-acetyltransferase GlmU [Nitrospiria bacterium]|nr:bifunctional UDP-N-acetylglucosamine diphosphorylase/glucosamine-1-phosphate N-acetyltransferase GlmU [Nitrospiria bacterium]
MSAPLAIILAAGLGTRMRSQLAKVLHPVAGRPMIHYPVLAAKAAGCARIVAVIGHQAREVTEALKGLPCQAVIQRNQLGTAHAVLQARRWFAAQRAPVVILNGDLPLLSDSTIRRLLDAHQSQPATLSLASMRLADPTGYGRVVRSAGGRVAAVVEEADATPAERGLTEVNGGLYVAEGRWLADALRKIRPDNAKREYYLTDLVKIAVAGGGVVQAVAVEAAEQLLGVNSRADLARAEMRLRERINARHLTAGVTMRHPPTVFIDDEVAIGQDCLLYPMVQLEGRTAVGAGSTLHAAVRIRNSRLGKGVTVLDGCVIDDSEVADGAIIGPCARLRPGARIGARAKVGNFVEIKQSAIGAGSKVNHLSYVGDTTIGRGVNVGAGTITCNYDGMHKHPTVIGDEVFVGSDVQFIAPVRIGRGAVIAAGTTVTRDVPPGALAISRAAQENKPGWVKKRITIQKKSKKKR